MTPHGDHRSRSELAKALNVQRAEFAEALYQAVRDSAHSAEMLPNRFAEIFDWWQAAALTAIDLADEWIKKPGELQGDFLSGWISNLDHPAMRPEGAQPFRSETVLRHAKPRWLSIIKGKVSAQASQLLSAEMDRLIEPLSRPKRKNLRLLIIGDCLLHEISACLDGPCGRAQIGVEFVHINELVPAIARNRIRGFGRNDFDLVFFSPFSYTFSPEYAQIFGWKTSLWPQAKFSRLLNQMMEEVSLTVHALAKQLSCPIYVHNSAAIVQVFSIFSGAAKNILSLRNRVRARKTINPLINRSVADPAFDGRIRLLDEESLRRIKNDFALGRVLFKGNVYHPTPLSIELGRGAYMEAIGSAAFLAGKKVVVCDLDNTLWNGVIGEGPVQHFADRQTILKGLRDRGVLLSINSKNDPARVDFSAAVLQWEDFVAPRINWEPKAANMAGILDELNLKEKDFVFIDDRLDELERVQNAFPAMTVLDAREPATWKWLLHWQKHLSQNLQEDRTRLYHERAAREQSLSHGSNQKVCHEDESAALTRLELSVKIEPATRPSDLKRVVELVNRTNQFNLCGSRVTMGELEKGLGEHQWVITAAAKDKFGSMGIVGVMVATRKAAEIEIPVFVLSCRAFGFGIEYALLRAVSKLTPGNGRLVGLHAETPHNQSCREFYAKAGLKQEEKKWVGTAADLIANPAWLTVESSLPEL